MQSHLSDIAMQLELRRGNGRWSGACPECGGSSKSDKFTIKDDGGFKCYGCSLKGDVINLFRKFLQMSCPSAHEAAGRECTLLTCPGREKCRLGDGKNGRAAGRRKARLEPMSRQQKNGLPSTSVTMPSKVWLAWGMDLLGQAIIDLQQQPEVLAWLAARGISAAAVKRFCLGWLQHDRKVNRAALGLEKKDGKDTLWIPGGLLIPIFDGRGQLHRLRVRRTAEAREKFLPDLKYVWLQGSGTGPLVIRPEKTIRGAVIVESELDAFAASSAHAEVMVIGLGSVSMGLPERLAGELHTLPSIMVALDADNGVKFGKDGAGPLAVKRWLQCYRQAKYWPVPVGKDPGEYAEQGGALDLWIHCGLAPVVHDVPLSPECPQPGEGGESFYMSSDDGEELETDPYIAEIKALDAAVRAEAMAAYAMMQGHPIMPWMTRDGSDCGIIATGSWKTDYPDLSRRFSQLFYGPAHEPLCRIFHERFVQTARLHGKGRRGEA